MMIQQQPPSGSTSFVSGTMMADNRNVPDSLTDLDNLDLDFEQSNNQNDFDNLLGQEAQDGQFALDDTDFEALLADTTAGGGNSGNAPAGGIQQVRQQQQQQQQQLMMAQNMQQAMPQPIPESMSQQNNLVDDLDPLKSMSINEVDLHDPSIHQSIRNSNARTQAANAQSSIGGGLVGQATSIGNQQIIQNNLVAQSSGMIAPQQVPAPQPVGGVGGGQVGGGSGVGALPNDLEAQKNFLLNKLKQVQIQKEKLAQSNGMPGVGGLQQTTPYPTPLQQATTRKQPLVASVNAGGSIKPTESALSSFLRGTRKTTLEDAAPVVPEPEEPASLLSSHIKGAPQAASIFNHAPMNVGNSNAFGMGMNNQQGSMMTKSMGRTGSGRNLMRTGSGRSLMGGSQNSGNASWGTGAESLQPASTGGYARSGIIRKNASEGALNHSLLRAKRSSASRENLSYMKRSTSGRNMLGSSENLQSMLPVRRANYSKHSLGRSASRSQPSLNLMTSRPSPKYQQNAQW